MSVDVALPSRGRLLGRDRVRVPVLTALAFVELALVVAWMVAGRWIAPHDPDAQDLLHGAAGPGGGHWLGTDSLGRDVLSRLAAGAQPSLVGPVCVAVAVTVIGSSLGVLAGYRGGAVDAVLNRFADLVYALPGLLVAVVVVGVVGGGYWLAVAILVFLSLPGQIRLARSATIVQVRLPYVDAARSLGLSGPRIMVKHVLPNILPTVVATFLLDFVGGLIGFSALAYLGLGVEPGSVAWGTMLADGQSVLGTNPWLSLAPAIMIMLTAASVTLIGDWTYDRLSRSVQS